MKMADSMSIKEIEGLSDSDLRELLQKYKIETGPITKSTRKIYEKKLSSISQCSAKTSSIQPKNIPKCPTTEDSGSSSVHSNQNNVDTIYDYVVGLTDENLRSDLQKFGVPKESCIIVGNTRELWQKQLIKMKCEELGIELQPDCDLDEDMDWS